MMKLKILIIFFIFSLGLFPQQTEKGDTPVKIYTLDECLKIAANKNTDIELSMAKLNPASADITSAFGEFLPSLSINSSYTHNWGGIYDMYSKSPDPLVQGLVSNYNINAGANYTLFNGFYRENNYQRAKDNFNSLYQNTLFTKERIKYDLYRNYVNVVMNKQILKTRKENYDLGQKDLERVKARYDAGVTSVNFVYSQEADLGQRELDIVKAQNDLKTSYTAILTVMGLNPDANADFSEESLPTNVSKTDISDFRNKIGSFEQALVLSFKNRQDFVSADLAIKSSEKSLEAASSTYYPTVSLQGGWQFRNSSLTDFGGQGSTFISLGLSIPVFENFKTNANIETAKLQVKTNQLLKFQLEQNIRASLRTSLLNLEAAEKQLEITDRSLVSAQKNFDYANERYREGATSISDYFLANNLLITTQINRITAVYNYFIAKKQVQFTLGQMD